MTAHYPTTPAQQAVQDVLDRLTAGESFPTPSGRARFNVCNVTSDGYIVETGENDSQLLIARGNLEDTYLFLLAHAPTATTPMEIGSDNLWERASPLCRIARGGPSRPRLVTYILPILAAHGLVEIGMNMPNTVWLPN